MNHNDFPPMFKHWSMWYALVIGALALLIFLFHQFTLAFR